jgi:hypothetical protein
MAEKRVFKSTKKLSGGKGIYRAWDKWAEDDTIIGEFKGTGKTDKYGHDTYLFQVEEAFFSKPKEAKEIRGQVLTLNHTGGFGKAMDGVESGQLVQIVYKGQNEIEKGKWKGQMAHAVEVDLVEEDTGEEEEVEEDEDDL